MTMHAEHLTIRLRLWLQGEEGIFFGTGRVLLLDLIEEHGSLKEAAQILGMSYRAAWGKLKATEKTLGAKLVEIGGAKRKGCRLTSKGRAVRDMFKDWFAAVENDAIQRAKDIFPWDVVGYLESLDNDKSP